MKKTRINLFEELLKKNKISKSDCQDNAIRRNALSAMIAYANNDSIPLRPTFDDIDFARKFLGKLSGMVLSQLQVACNYKEGGVTLRFEGSCYNDEVDIKFHNSIKSALSGVEKPGSVKGRLNGIVHEWDFTSDLLNNGELDDAADLCERVVIGIYETYIENIKKEKKGGKK